MLLVSSTSAEFLALLLPLREASAEIGGGVKAQGGSQILVNISSRGGLYKGGFRTKRLFELPAPPPLPAPPQGSGVEWIRVPISRTKRF